MDKLGRHFSFIVLYFPKNGIFGEADGANSDSSCGLKKCVRLTSVSGGCFCLLIKTIKAIMPKKIVVTLAIRIPVACKSVSNPKPQLSGANTKNCVVMVI